MTFQREQAKLFKEIMSGIERVGKADKEKLIAEIRIMHGLSLKKIAEYLDTLVIAEYIEIEDGVVISLMKDSKQGS